MELLINGLPEDFERKVRALVILTGRKVSDLNQLFAEALTNVVRAELHAAIGPAPALPQFAPPPPTHQPTYPRYEDPSGFTAGLGAESDDEDDVVLPQGFIPESQAPAQAPTPPKAQPGRGLGGMESPLAAAAVAAAPRKAPVLPPAPVGGGTPADEEDLGFVPDDMDDDDDLYQAAAASNRAVDDDEDLEEGSTASGAAPRSYGQAPSLSADAEFAMAMGMPVPSVPRTRHDDGMRRPASLPDDEPAYDAGRARRARVETAR